ncbi:MAG: hypothetical protein R3C14_16350 [Caldilineaceae bacterium]
MAKRKSKKNRPGSRSAQTHAVAPVRETSTAPAGSSRGWVWTWGGLGAALLLVAGALFFLRELKPAASNALAAATTPSLLISTPTATTAPEATRAATTLEGVVDYCRRSPKFRDTQGFSSRSVLSTAERNVKGAIMYELGPNGQVLHSYQDPSWEAAGYLGHVILDRNGDVYTFPAPYVSLIDNPPELQNIIYRIDSTTAKMTRFYTLTATTPVTPENPFGLMGLAYDCDTNSLYASSVAGSTRTEALGQIVRLDLASREVRFRYEGVDAFGLSLYAGADGKRLYYGLARAPEIYSIGVDAAGDLLDDARLEITLPDPTLKARRVIFSREGTLQVRSRPFDFNLIVTSERPEVVYNYTFDPNSHSWQLMQ